MAEPVSVLVSVLAVALGGALPIVGARAARLRRKLADVESRALAAGNDVQDLTRRLQWLASEDHKKMGWLHHKEEEIAFLRGELDKRTLVVRRAYKIITFGVKGTGKTSLTLKWANPLIQLNTIVGTKIERYERTVSRVVGKDTTTEHVFEVADWGGEHIVDAHDELILNDVHGMLIVVDLGGKDAKAVDEARVQEQLRQFQPESLRFFFGSRVASCKTVVLFINKSDLLAGTPAEIDAQAKRLYAKLIDDLMQYKDRFDIHVLVGSATYGHATHELFPHFISKILPASALDHQASQGPKGPPPLPVARPQPAKPPPLPTQMKA